MRSFRRTLALALGLVLAAGATQADAQMLTDKSGDLTFTANVAKYVDVVSHSTGSWEITGGIAGGGTPGTIWQNPGGIKREIKANTAFSLAIEGLITGTSDFNLVHTVDPTQTIKASLGCQLSDVENPASSADYTNFTCTSAGVSSGLPTTALPSKWVTLNGYVSSFDNKMAIPGTYRGTVFLRIDAL